MKSQRILLFALIMVLLFVATYMSTGSVIPRGQPSVVIFSALVMLAFTTLFLEHFFTRPTDVVASTIAILLLLSPLAGELSAMGAWYSVFYVYNLLMLGVAVAALFLLDGSKPESAWQNRASSHLKRFAVFFGNGRLLYFALLILTMLFYVNNQSPRFLVLFAFAVVVLLINPQKLAALTFTSGSRTESAVGEIFGVQSKGTFLAKLYQERPPLRRFDFVEFSHRVSDSPRATKGLIVDRYLLDQEEWVKILTGPPIATAAGSKAVVSNATAGVVYRIEAQDKPGLLNRFVGLVIEGSTIDRVRFEYTSQVPVAEGDLIEIQCGAQVVLYQVVEAATEVELLKSKDEAGLIVGTAIQLGTWNQERRTFEKFGWVPEINTSVLLARSTVKPPEREGEIEIGCIPNTEYPVFLNVGEGLAHHIAILGVTGSGKSVFSRNLVRRMLDQGVKVICVDFTNEYAARFTDLAPKPVVEGRKSAELFNLVDALDVALAEFKNKQDRVAIAGYERDLVRGFSDGIEDFLKSERQLSVFELPDVANTTGILDYTRWFFKALFEIAKTHRNFGQRLCVVLEEAHTVIPEWNSIGVDEKRAGALVNAIGQIALQGRKYDVGFVVVAQRTATVSKTVLTQCNSIVAFQQFDNTATAFLGNHMGSRMADALTTLQPRHAVAVGRGFSSGVPVIFQVPEIVEPPAPKEPGGNEPLRP